MRPNWKTSQALLERARQSLAGGVSSPFRAFAPMPLYFSDGEGARLTDVDGNEYIDYALGWGPMILGYRHPSMVEAMRRQAERPVDYGAQHELEIAVAEKIQSLVPCAERVAFTSSGSEAVQLAFRLARAFTGRNRILRFEGHYHGWMDSALISYRPSRDAVGPEVAPHAVLGSKGQVSSVLEDVAVSPWNHLDLLEEILAAQKGEIAAVITEPILCNSGCILPQPGFLNGLRELCNRHGALLIFDEVITGFRAALGGAQGLYGVTPDLAAFGKAVAGGVPLSVVAGRNEILEQMIGGGVSFGGTFNGNPLSLAGAGATLAELSRDEGALLDHARLMGERLIHALRSMARKHGVPLTVTGVGTAFYPHFSEREQYQSYRDIFDDNEERKKKFLRLALEEGVQLVPDGRFYVSCAHTERDIDETAEALERAFQRLAT